MSILGRREFVKSLVATLPIPFLFSYAKSEEVKTKKFYVGDSFKIDNGSSYKIYKVESKESRAKDCGVDGRQMPDGDWIHATNAHGSRIISYQSCVESMML